MRCITCSKTMITKQAGSITVDVCEDGCGALWFDQLELKRLDEPTEGAGEELLGLGPDKNVAINREKRRDCPRCDASIMMRFFYSPSRNVSIDHCPECGGHWLDAGELAGVRSLYSSDEERAEHLDAIVEEQFGSELDAMAQDREELKRKTSQVRRIFSFLVPMPSNLR